mmetsp:Transcript_75203/g.126510  ORF Transcript_75203/g.126510 Transcript_75203/m.126510 type:complete len:221 (+) Transcript_75203:877-1539(+)
MAPGGNSPGGAAPCGAAWCRPGMVPGWSRCGCGCGWASGFGMLPNPSLPHRLMPCGCGDVDPLEDAELPIPVMLVIPVGAPCEPIPVTSIGCRPSSINASSSTFRPSNEAPLPSAWWYITVSCGYAPRCRKQWFQVLIISRAFSVDSYSPLRRVSRVAIRRTSPNSSACWQSSARKTWPQFLTPISKSVSAKNCTLGLVLLVRRRMARSTSFAFSIFLLT